ncbi:MAG TPA: four helix bundle protein [Bacteroidia bacterium]|jgi:four helix bundle protein|nr:four helix bundle protein [Bacteroidia bacterium]
MKAENVVQEKSYAFAIRIVKLYRYLTEKKNEYVLSKQVLRSGTSIGANIEEGIGGQSKKDFYSKLNIAYKEARETKYWLRLLRDTNYLSIKEAEAMLEDCEELLKIIGSIIRTMKTKFKS